MAELERIREEMETGMNRLDLAENLGDVRAAERPLESALDRVRNLEKQVKEAED